MAPTRMKTTGRLLAELTFSGWKEHSSHDRKRIIRTLCELLGSEFVAAKASQKNRTRLPEFQHTPSQTAWTLIPGGEFQMGLSEEEEHAARQIEDPPPLNLSEMRPCQAMNVEPFLMMKYPVTLATASNYVTLDSSAFRPSFPGRPEEAVAYLTRTEVDALVGKLGHTLPTERQWEYACRAGTRSLFFFGDALPSEEKLARYVSPEMFSPFAEPNAFGLYGLFIGEWCLDRFTPSYVDPAAKDDAYVIRGGASVFWPWQDAGEWVFCASAMRMPSTDLAGGTCGIRFVRNIDQQSILGR